MKPANNAPPFVLLYSQLAEIFREHGYALAIHGSVACDFDLVAIPWTEDPSTPATVMITLMQEFGGHLDKITPRLHGRRCYGFLPACGGFLDISFMPIQKEKQDKEITCSLK